MKVPENMCGFWEEYLATSDRETTTVPHDVFSFGDSEELATWLTELVLRGYKRRLLLVLPGSMRMRVFAYRFGKIYR